MTSILDHITNQINASLGDGSLADKRFKPAKFFGVASAFEKQGVISPGVMHEDGEIETVVPDDRYALQVYHKLNTISYADSKATSYGDNREVVRVMDMSAYVFAVSNRVHMQAEELEPYISFGLPQEVNIPGHRTCIVRAVGADMDKIRNYKNEFQNIKKFLAPNHIFFSVRYQAKMVVNQECVFACPTS